MTRPSAAEPPHLEASRTEESRLPVDQPTPERLSVLKRFVVECVSIKPGELKLSGGAGSDGAKVLKVDKAFRICRFETTQELYLRVMGQNPSRWRGPRNSVEQICFDDAVVFCQKLTGLLRQQNLIATNEIVRLPSAVEWEYACRAGAKTRYCFGDSPFNKSGKRVLDDYAWHSENAAGNDPSVGMLKPNRWGLADVHGYLWEFTQEPVFGEAKRDTEILARGGSWRAAPDDCDFGSTREVSRLFRSPDLGFRCVVSSKVAIKNNKRQ